MSKLKLFGISFLIQVIGIIGNLIARVFFGNMLNESDFGIYNIVILMPNLIALIVNIGMGHAISIIVSRNSKYFVSIIKKTYIYSIMVGSLASIFGIIIFSNIYKNLDLSLIILGCGFTLVFLMNYLLSFLLLGLQKTSVYFWSTNLTHILSPLIFLSITNLLIDNLTTAIISYGISIIIVTLYLNFNLYIIYRKNNDSAVNEEVNIKELLELGVPMYLTSIFNFLNYRIDVFIIGALLPFSLLSNYTVSVLFVDSVGKVNQIINTLIFQKIPTLKNGNSKEKLMFQGLILSFFITFLASLALILIGEYLISVIFPGKFEKAYILILILIPGMFFISFFRIIYHRLAADGYGKYSSIGSFISMILTVILNIILIPFLSIYGSALASSIAYFVMFIYILYIYLKLKKKDKLN